ncbi:TonB-dependent receptor plug domain-containing protein [Parapedobacter koreensis]|uniref:TonB-dependent outer membrane receptor, SusC/RagA subfamily, signature region n=1 Tax=Parapedobacter koreensis TaxID=332977 RepID=A0A1H7QAN5_9SPHI|nr:TonB-dependent receptor plug domain-containing protein [Parapedobacter koreensis]SEL44946.1 TonB-dependent outer membrane receptor, SusC/RagA subfamily, signature region [Parapedobacter koreensis]
MRRALSILIVSWLSIQALYPQDTAIDGVLKKLGAYADEYPQEKVYLHLDKPYYTVGDDIWFKGYVTIGAYNYLSGFSKILYVDLISPQDKIIQSIRLPLIAGVTMGDFQLADSLGEGNYRLRAYTNWMRNFDNDIFYDRVLPIGNARTDSIVTNSSFSYENSPIHTVNADIAFTNLRGGPLADMDVNYQVTMEGLNIDRGRTKTDEHGQIAVDFVNKQPFSLKTGAIELTLTTPAKQTVNKTIPLRTTSNTNSIRFFPESGHLVAGNLAKVAFKALAPEGLGIGVKGYVEDDKGVRVADLESTYAGMGNFSFIPQVGNNYVAKVTYADGSQATQALPQVAASGYTLAVNNELDKQLFVQATATDDRVNGQEITLLLQRNGAIFYASKSKLSKKEVVFAVPREHIPSGVVQITLFGPNMRPLAERAIFNMDRASILPMTVSTDQDRYGPKQKVSVKVSVGNPTDTSRIATLSAAVIDLAKVPVDSGIREGNIYASLLLSSDIKGYIETPEYYFEDMDMTKRRQLDNVMLTQGWSRINWQELMAGKTPAITYHPEQDLRISGVVTKRDGKTPVPNATVTVLSTNNVTAVIDTVAGPDGRFSFDRLLFYDDTKFVVQARDERGRRNVDVHLDESPRQQVTRNKNTPDATVNVNQSISTYLKNTQEQFSEMEKYGLKEKTILLQEVKVTREAEEKKVRHSSNLNGPGNADQVITADQLIMGCPTLDQCLQGRLLGVIFRNGIPYSTRSFNQPMQIVLDGMFMEPGALSIINPFDVETIEVLRGIGNTAIYGSRGGGGVLIITTKRGDSGGYNRDLYTPGIVTHSPQGYYEVREFYAPDYSAPTDSLTGMKDLRTTIHWIPNVVTDQEGNASFEFYTAESPSTYRIVLEGLDVDGRLGRAVHYIKVD